MHEYDLIADWFGSDRGRTGVAEVLAMGSQLPPGAHILDLGCGNGVPLTEALVKAGYLVTGLDSSAGMLERFRQNLPNTPAVHGDARNCPFQDDCFDAEISVGMLFHLPPKEQPKVFASVARVLKPGALFLFTAAEITNADEKGITGTMNGLTFHYYALSNYRDLLTEHGFSLIHVHEDPGVATYFTARRSHAQS
jgi:ubiquinone/menaquinone biosynthesis C-methylase UbiE